MFGMTNNSACDEVDQTPIMNKNAEIYEMNVMFEFTVIKECKKGDLLVKASNLIDS